MLKFNTQARERNRLFSHEQVFQPVSQVSIGRRSVVLTVLLSCCFSLNLWAQCDILCPASPNFNLSLNSMGQATIDPTVFEPLVSSSFIQCLPANGGVLQIWEDAAGTIPYPTAIPGPNFDCTDVGLVLPPLFVTLNDPGPGTQSPTCQFNVTIVDNQVPIITPAANITVNTDPGPSCASVRTLTATLTDNCPSNVVLDHVLTGATTGTFPSFTATHAYNEGVTVITWRANDGVNPIVTATTTVTVNDVENPEILAPIPNSVTLSANASCQANHSFTIPNISDNCGVSAPAYTYQATGATNFGPLTATPGANINFNYPLGTTTITLKVTDVNGNMDTETFTITVNDNAGPSFGAAPTNQTVSPAGCSANVTINMTSFITDNCNSIGAGTITTSYTVNGGAPQSGANASGTYTAGVHTIVFTATDQAGNSTTHTFTLTVNDFVDPVAVCQNITAQLNSSGTVTVNAMDLDDGSSDNCGITQFLIRPNPPGLAAFAPSMTFNCTDIGVNPVQFRVVDANGNTDEDNTCSVTVEDNVIPEALCQNISVNLAGGPPQADVFAAAVHGSPFINDGSNDNCPGGLTIQIRKGTSGAFENVGDPVTYTCAEIGLRTVEIRVIDAQGNQNFCQATVDVNDNVAPNAVAAPVNPANLSATIGAGSVTITPADIEAGSTDNCNITKYEIGESTSGPWFSTTTSPNGVVFDCSDLAAPNPETVFLRVTDGDGNTDIASTTVTLFDVTDPTPVCPATPIDVFLDITGNVSVSGMTVGANSTDNCTINLWQIQKTAGGVGVGAFANSHTFNCSELGNQDVRLRVRDISNNPVLLGAGVYCTNAINVIDNVGPTAVCLDVSVPVNSSGNVLVTAAQLGLASTDNCTPPLGALTFAMSVDMNGDGNGDTPFAPSYLFDCDDILTNDNLVEVRVTDPQGNSTICESEVTIEDNEDPVITCPAGATILCTANSTPAALGTATATDNCTTASSPTILPHSDAISNVVCTGTYRITRTWTAEDDYGNQDQCNQIIEVQDNSAPTFAAPADMFGLECPMSFDVANHTCTTLVSTNVPIDIFDNTTSTVTSQILANVPVNGKITDISLSVQISHTRVEDLYAELEFIPSGTIAPGPSTPLFSALCPGAFMDVDLEFEDGGVAYGSIPCPPTNQSLVFDPLGSLSTFQNLFINGTWILRVVDSDPTSNGGGQITGWSLDICYVPQEMDLSLTGNVVGTDNCDPDPDESFFDYHAYKDFAFHPEGGAYNFSTPLWAFQELPFAHDGFTSVAGAPASIFLTGANDGTANAETNFGIPVPAGGVGPFFIAFDWSYQSNNSAAGYDPFGVKINGVFTQLTVGAYGTGSGATTQGGREIIPVSPGDFFQFSQQSSDGFAGSATTTITNFLFIDGGCPIPAVNCPREFCVARFWDVVDDCGNPAATQLQIISTADTNTPSFGAAPTTMSEIAPTGICTPNLTIDFSSFITDGGCSDEITMTNTALADYGNGDGMADASGFYAPGTYTITFTATDECGNTTNHVLTLQVIDDQDPDAKCVDYTVQLNNMGQATVLLTDVDNGSLDNCPGMTLSFAAPPAPQVSTITMTTANIGPNTVTLYAEDASGNVSSCVSIVTVLGGVLIDAEDAAGTTGSTVMVPIVTNDEFTDVGSFSVKIEIVDGSVATIGAGGVTAHPDLAALGGTLLFNTISATEVLVSWFSPSSMGSDLLPPNFGLFMVEADLIGAAGTTTPVQVEDDVVNKIISGVSTTVPSFGLAGTISVLNASVDFTISGNLLEAPICGSDGIHLVDVALTGAPSTPASPIMNAAGSYSFDVPQGSNVTVMPTKDVTWFDGSVDIFDVLLVNQHFLGIPPLLDSPYKILAADINRNNSVDIADVFAINQVSLGNLPAGLGDPWGFVDSDHTFANPFNPWTAPVPHSIIINNVQADDLAADFTGYHLGDVDCTVDPTQLNSEPVTDGFPGTLPFVTLDQAVAAGEIFTIDFKAQSFADYMGYQTSIQFDPQILEFIEFLPAANVTNLTANNLNASQATEGLLATNWYNVDALTLADGEVVFSLQFKAVQEMASLADMLVFNDGLIAGKAVKADGGTHGVDLVFDSPTSANEVEGSGFALYQNRPNPFGQSTQIGFTLPENTAAKLTISDASGRVLRVVEGTYSAGYHQVSIDRGELSANGVLLYRLETAQHTAVRKMILLD